MRFISLLIFVFLLPVSELLYSMDYDSTPNMNEVEDAFSKFIADYELIYRARVEEQEELISVLQTMRLTFTMYDWSRSLPSSFGRKPDLGPCSTNIFKEASLAKLSAPVQSALRLYYFSKTQATEMSALLRKSEESRKLNERDFFLCMEKNYSKSRKPSENKIDIKQLQKHFESLIAK